MRIPGVIKLRNGEYTPLNLHLEDCRRGTLPNVSWIIPSFSMQFDEHPDADVSVGMGFQQQIIEALQGSPLWGKSYREIGTDAFANHRTQGITAFLASPFLRRPIGIVAEGGGSVDPKQFGKSLSQTEERCAAGIGAETRRRGML